LGIKVAAFGVPTREELAHDFLWRVHAACPKHGWIGVFNRSHYEDVLVAKVRSLATRSAIEARYEQINDFERLLASNGTVLRKFFLHISKDEQRERLLERLSDPEKLWKFNPGDLDDRGSWKAFENAYETAFKRCSTELAPWFVIPSDRKWARNAAVAAIVRETLASMNPQCPPGRLSEAEVKIHRHALQPSARHKPGSRRSDGPSVG
jgi:PPK2 family polyphosphate:nucleotide phosphotransferase